MTTLHERITTPLAQEAAFEFVADFANSMHWDPGVVSSTRIDEGPLGVGARFHLEVRLGGRVAPMDYRITTFESPRLVVLVGEGSGVSAVDEIRFDRHGTGTRIDYTADIHLGGALRFVQPFLGRAFDRLGREALAGMQGALDARAATTTEPGQADPG